jgi:hypothetical protein
VRHCINAHEAPGAPVALFTNWGILHSCGAMYKRILKKKQAGGGECSWFSSCFFRTYCCTSVMKKKIIAKKNKNIFL